MPATRSTSSLLVLFCCLTCTTWTASQRTGAVIWSARIADADLLTEARSFRVYETPDELQLILGLSNDTSTSFVLTQEAVEQAVSIVLVSSETEIPATFTWSLRRIGLSLPPTSPSESIDIPSGSGATWNVSVRRQDSRAFVANRYSLLLTYHPIAATSASDPTQKVTPRLGFSKTSVFAVTGPAITDSERAAAHRYSGQKALLSGDNVAAIRAYQESLKLEAENLVALSGLGWALLQSGRFAEAVDVLELRLKKSDGALGRSLLPSHLATAYVGAGNELRARDVLQKAGYTSDAVEIEIARLREVVDKIRRRD